MLRSGDAIRSAGRVTSRIGCATPVLIAYTGCGFECCVRARPEAGHKRSSASFGGAFQNENGRALVQVRGLMSFDLIKRHFRCLRCPWGHFKRDLDRSKCYQFPSLDAKPLTRFCWSALVKDLAQEELGPFVLRIIEELCR